MSKVSRVGKITRLPANGSTAIVVGPPLACGLTGCVAELHVSIGSSIIRAHLNDVQRNGLIAALQGE